MSILRFVVGVTVLILTSGCEEPGQGYAVPGVRVGMAEEEVLDRLGTPTETRDYPVVHQDSVQLDEPGTIDSDVADLAISQAPGDTALVRHSTWENVQTWPWEASRAWDVVFTERDGAWRVYASVDLSSNVVIE